MRSAVLILAAAAVVAAEAPYHLPRPAPHGPSFGYPSGPAPPPPAPFPQLPQPRPAPQPFSPYPQPGPAPSQGYNYQQPSIGPALTYPAPQPAPKPIPVYRPPPQIYLPAPLPIPHPQPIPISYPQPQPLPAIYPRPQPISIPQPNYGLPQPQFQPQSQPSFIYNVPQAHLAPAAPIPVPTFSKPQSFIYQQSITQPQFSAFPLQSQPLTNNAVSSYQADSNQYATATHSEALDDTVVSRVQNIIRDSEHASAKNAGYLSLVSGVSLESAKPSIELSSFVYNSPQNDAGAGLIDVRSASSNAAQLSSSVGAATSSSYELPTVSVANSQLSNSGASLGVILNNKPGNSYGVPK